MERRADPVVRRRVHVVAPGAGERLDDGGVAALRRRGDQGVAARRRVLLGGGRELVGVVIADDLEYAAAVAVGRQADQADEVQVAVRPQQVSGALRVACMCVEYTINYR